MGWWDRCILMPSKASPDGSPPEASMQPPTPSSWSSPGSSSSASSSPNPSPTLRPSEREPRDAEPRGSVPTQSQLGQPCTPTARSSARERGAWLAFPLLLVEHCVSHSVLGSTVNAREGNERLKRRKAEEHPVSSAQCLGKQGSLGLHAPRSPWLPQSPGPCRKAPVAHLSETENPWPHLSLERPVCWGWRPRPRLPSPPSSPNVQLPPLPCQAQLRPSGIFKEAAVTGEQRKDAAPSSAFRILTFKAGAAPSHFQRWEAAILPIYRPLHSPAAQVRAQSSRWRQFKGIHLTQVEGPPVAGAGGFHFLREAETQEREGS